MDTRGFRAFSRGDPVAAVLRDKIRYAREPDNPQLLHVWFELEDALLATDALEEQWQLYVAELHLLLDAFADDLLPRHWRALCLDNITRPLAELSRIANRDNRRSELQQLMRELRIISHFFLPGLMGRRLERGIRDMRTRIEKDSMGELEVPEDALYAAQTQRAINNFPVSGQAMPAAFMRALLQAKAAAAQANAQLEQISEPMSRAICQAVDDLLADEGMMRHFPVDVFQTGSGTSSNMNANEVLATLATRNLGDTVNPNDHVNCGQSSNDIIPSSIHISAAVELENRLLPALSHLEAAIRDKAAGLEGHVKTGRTHLMDAMPVRLSQSLLSWASQIEQNISALQSMRPALQALAQGGTAVGTGINAHPEFAALFHAKLSERTGIDFKPAENLFSRIGSQDTAVSLSGQLKATAVSILKIANDLRWMNSGPLAGLGEIELEALQPGSSIMPGKVNPVIPEAAAMVAAQVIGNDAAVTLGGASGNFELNVMLPLIARNLLESIALLANVTELLADKAVTTFKVNEQNLQAALARNPILVTALNPIIGYSKAADIAKQAYRDNRPIIDVAAEQTELSRAELTRLLDPAKLTEGGI